MGLKQQMGLDTALDKAKRERRIARAILSGGKPGRVARRECVTIADVAAAVAKFAPEARVP